MLAKHGRSPIDERVARFERVALAVASLNHPSILAQHHIGNEAGGSPSPTLDAIRQRELVTAVQA